MRLMKAEGVIITGDDIAQVPADDKKRKRIVKVKKKNVKIEDTSISGAEAPEGKTTTDEKKAYESVATEDIGASEAKETGKGKAIKVTESEEKTTTEKSKGESTKKPRTVKQRAPRIQRKMVIHSDEETQEEPTFKRKRAEPIQNSEPKKAQPASENMDTEADT
ncbi:hypothetical protein A2U01_0035514, partial [Trifolium medium]|nr:hypothetical protein [Trifolium medium]